MAPFILNLENVGWDVSLTPRPFYTSEADPVATYRRLGAPQGQSGFWEENVICPCRDLNPTSSTQQLVVIPPALFRLLAGHV